MHRPIHGRSASVRGPMWLGFASPVLTEHYFAELGLERDAAGCDMTNCAKFPTWADKNHVYAVVETPRGSRAKLEFDPKLGAFTLAKPLLVGLT